MDPQFIFGHLEGCEHCEAARPAVAKLAAEVPGLKVAFRNVSKGEKFPVPEVYFPAFALLDREGKMVANTNATVLPNPITGDVLAAWVLKMARAHQQRSG